LKFILHGEKLQGKWMLVRHGGKRADASERHWFLFKERDDFARPGSDIAAEAPLSVTTGRDLDEIAAQADRVWGPDGEVRTAGRGNGKAKSRAGGLKPKGPATKQKRKTGNAAAHKARIAKAMKAVDGKLAPFPKQAQVQLATLAKTIPDSDDWIHEIKFDGYRMLCHIDAGKVHFSSRNGKDWTKNFPELTRAMAELPIESAIVDREDTGFGRRHPPTQHSN
jgi:bifunctional non-homologous end joining protein LigD